MLELAVLIPAYNEAPRIEPVLDVVCSYSRNQEVVVIDDGSQDDTREVARKHPVELIVHSENRGKGAALQAGIDHIGAAERWLFLDADLIDLTHGHMEGLLRPFEDRPELGMTVGQFRGSNRTCIDLAQSFVSILNGQRGLSGAFVAQLPDLSWSRFGVEIVLSRLAERRGIPIETPILKGLGHYTKEEKFGVLPGLAARLKMYRECLRAHFQWETHCLEASGPGGSPEG